MNMEENIISETNINNSYINLDNQFYTVEWFIDTRPDYNLSNNYEVSNPPEYFTETIMNNYLEDEFIPFETYSVKHVSIDTEVHEIPVSDEERNCCICYEIKDCEDISHINCGHKFCGTCIIDHISINYINPCCPLCREKIVCITFQRDFYEADFRDL
jgi:hypothetical protein